MNIFATDYDPGIAAENLDNSRVVKLILESAQMLSTALWEEDSDFYLYNEETLYRPAHRRHPCTLWVRETADNFRWLLRHFQALNGIYYDEYGKRHAAWKMYPTFWEGKDILPPGDQTPFVNCAQNLTLGISYADVTDTVDAYRRYLSHRWAIGKRSPKFGHRGNPEWYDRYRAVNSFERRDLILMEDIDG